MNRRNFLGALPFTGYSLVVLADKLPPPALTPASAEDIRRRHDPLAPPKAASKGLSAERHMTEVRLETDFLVAGGGLAGVCAAIAAARHGAKVVLVQDRSRLGGNSSSEVKMHVMGANSRHTGWREGGILEEVRLLDAVNNPQRCWELWDLALYDKVISEPNITLLLDSTLYAAKMKDGRIEEAAVRCDRTEHIYHIRAKMFCDATGDSRLALEAGAEMRTGREARSEFGESHAMEKADQETLGSSILFTSRHYEHPMPFTPPTWARKITKETLRFRTISSWEYGYWWIAWGGDKDTIRDNERIRFELLSIALGVWDYIKNSDEHPSSASWALDWIGMIPGKRGSRRLVGDYILAQKDLENGGQFDDGVALGGWPMDDHPPGGFDREESRPNIAIHTPDVYNIPLRSLYSKNVPNLFMAGRNISCSHVAFTSARVMSTCAVVGQAAGTAAALALDRGVMPRDLYRDKTLLKTVQQKLLRDDQTIRGAVNEDAEDLARAARVTASAEIGPARAANLIDGHTRDYPRKEGSEIHHWAAKLDGGAPWIELGWDQPRRIGEVQLAFDTGFQRMLTLSSQNNVNTRMVRAAQPETVRDYTVAVRARGSRDWTEVASVKGNYQRLRRHRFTPVEAEAVRVTVAATNGLEEARIFEVRCYA
ncbi:MAG: FAD-dependent oxidoreductase [Bryobacterales bacterium]|nr:FAD-dependent oxidoreductase [Bryobacterales bacterium]